MQEAFCKQSRRLRHGRRGMRREPVRRSRGKGLPGATGGSALLATTLVGVTLVVPSCGDGAVEPAPPSGSRAATVKINPASATLTALGETARFTAEVRDQNGQTMAGAAVAWASSDASVALVDRTGLVTAADNGTATITATAGEATGTAMVTVAQAVSAVTVSPAADTVVQGDTLRLAAEAADANGRAVADAAIAWASSDTLVASVDEAGLVTGVTAGEVEISATSSGVTGLAALTVTVPVPAVVAVTPDTVALTALGQTAQLAAEVRDQVGRVMEGHAVAWASADTLVATVDSAGLVTAVGGGATTVAASAGEAAGEALVAVMQAAGSVVVSPPAATVGLGDTLRLAAEAFDANGNAVAGAAFTWSSSDRSVATVDASGLVTGVAEGAATIAAMAGDARGSSEITVANPDRAALVALYEATDGPNWVNNDGWLTDAPLGEWYGVETGRSGRVVSLDLSGRWDADAWEWVSHGLSGPIPPELGNLANLTGLYLYQNDLYGPIPPELGGLANLRSLVLYGNDLSGAIPPELGGLANLGQLELGENDLSGAIPPELGGLANLERVYLGRNDLSGAIPPELGNLANLKVLALGSNRLTGPIPSELGNLAELERLYLGSTSPVFPSPNDLSGPIPPELGRLANLTVLALGSNRLTGRIPPELGGLASLEWMYLFDNDLSGPVPPELGDLGSLRVLQLAGTQLCVPGVGRLVRWIDGMESFSGSYCNESDAAVLGSLHESAGGPDWLNSAGWLGGPALEEWHGVGIDPLGRVRTLDLSGNGLAGTLPSGLGGLTELAELRIGDNAALAGRLPVSLTRLSLSVLHYAGTDVCSPEDDTFRAWLGGVASHEGTGTECAPLSERDVLTELYQSTDGPNWLDNENWLTDAPLGEWYGVETDGSGRVVSLDIAENDLFGSIPPEFGGLAHLTYLSLYGNYLSGAIPPELDGLAGLTYLDLGGNELSGPVPPELGGLAGLTYLDLSGNELSGPVPPELGRPADLTRLDLGWNELSGPIPPELSGLANLTVLHLGGNDLSGSIPSELGDLTNLRGLYLYGNDLSGPVPPELSRLADLGWLRLDWNELSGPVPPELSRLANLRGLYLHGNELSGPIPPELGRLANLTRLFLDRNDLSGAIPAELGNLARLESLLLLNNDLAGPLPPEFGRLAGLTELDLTNNAAMFGSLPASLVGLRNLESLYARGTGLCAPDDDAGFRAWLDGVAEAQIATCAPASAYLVQAVQSREFPVPLVAAEEALLRVFITADGGAEARIPPVRARFYLDGTEAHTLDIPAGSQPIPAEVDESSLSNSANAVIPAEVVRPGLEMVVEVDPDGTLDSGLGVAERIPATGRLAVDVREMPRFDLTVIPFLWASEPDSSVIGFAEGMAADPEGHELLAVTHTLLPVADIAVTAHAPVTSSSNSGFAVLRETRAIAALEGVGGHHMGLMAGFSDVGGVAYLGGRWSASVPRQDVMAHELGHNMSLRHAPCGGAGGPDPRFPYPGGSIGAWGYDFPGEYDVRPGEPVSPGRDDLMGYCGPPDWISDYHFARALDFRLADEGPAAAAERSILVWGGVDADGALFLDPAFAVDAPPALPDFAGEYEVTGRTAEGGELFSLGFAMPEIADADGASAFVFVVPAEPGWAGSLASLTLSGPAGEATLDGGTDRPMAILRDTRNGEIRGFLRDFPPATTRANAIAAVAPEPGIEVLFSRGLPSWR